MDKFILHSQYKPMGDQPQAIAELTDGVNRGFTEQTLLGVTGSGKTFTMANVIANLNRPTLILAHNKTLALSSVPSFASFSLKTQSSILFRTTTTISRRLISRQRTLISKRIPL